MLSSSVEKAKKMSLEESIKAVGGIRFAFLSPSEIREYFRC